GAQQVMQIGGSGNGAGVMLSSITAVQVLGDYRVVVLDAAEHAVHLVSASGRSSVRFGRKGSGPGEFLSPTSMQVTSDGQVLVYDKSLLRFTWLAVRDDSLTLSRTAAIEQGIHSFCLTGDGSVVGVSSSAPQPLQRYSVVNRRPQQ